MFGPEPIAATHDVELIGTPKRVRARFADAWIVDTLNAVVLRQRGRPPEYLLPRDDVAKHVLHENGATKRDERMGGAAWYDLRSGEREVERAALVYRDPVEGLESLADHVLFKWNALDAWFEEDEEIDVHPRDPRHRIDVRPSSRKVTVKVNGEVIARSERPTILFETGLKPRYYLPRTDVRWEYLEPSDTTTGCPYKGWASYHSIRVGDTFIEDGVWSYRYPRPGSIRVANLMCFYDEKMDAFEVDMEGPAIG